MKPQDVTPPPSIIEPPLTPPSTDKKPAADANRVIALFRDLEGGRNTKEDNWIEFQLVKGEFDQIQSALQQDAELSGYVKDKIRYDYDEYKRKLAIRMPSAVHELFTNAVEYEIWSQLKAIRDGSDRKARFAQKVQSTGSTEISFATSTPSSKSKYEPDASFGHEEAKYPGVIIETAYSQKKERLRRLADNYLLDSDANIRAVVCLDIEYGKKSRKATVSIWRPEVFPTADGPELKAVEKPADEAFRDNEGNPVDHPGLRLRLSDFTYEGLAQKELEDEDADIYISGTQLCQYLDAADSRVKRVLGQQTLPKEVRKRKRLETPPEEILSSDEARYAEQEERVAKRADHDVDYRDESNKSLSD
ncbi:hypothetical protein EJ07DRAFT_100106 [Lizonia empirigonia]|nr:hypothetical protein EJ07DRAFT_100106 [Lizonia empirigonia]